MVLWELWQVIVATTMNADKGDTTGHQSLQVLTMADRNKPIAGTMENIHRAVNAPDPFIYT